MRVFLSHGTKDAQAASRIRAVLSDRGFQVWDPDRQLLPGSNWLVETGRALEKSDAVVFLLSGDPAHELNARREVQYVISHRKFENRVVPVRLGGGKIPWILESMSVVDAVDNNVDRAADEIAVRLRSVDRRKRGAEKKALLKAGKLGLAKAAKRTAKRVSRRG